MALRRTFSLRSLFSARFCQPSYSGISLRDNVHEEKPNYGSVLHQRSFGSSIISQHVRSSSHLSLCTPFGVSIYQRSMSTSQVPTDWSFQFDVQPLIETVHSYTGFNWWTSIVLTTLLIRGVTIPLMIDSKRWTSRAMMLGIHATASVDTKDPAALAGHSIEFDKLEKKYGGIFSLSPFLSLLQVPAFFCIGQTINNMAGEIASFKTGGALWFTDLTTPDTLIFPLLTGLTLCIMIERDAMIGVEGLMVPKKLTGIMAISMFFQGLTLSKAEHCYWMSCMLFSIAFTYVTRRPGVMNHFGIPEVPEHVPIIIRKRLFGYWL